MKRLTILTVLCIVLVISLQSQCYAWEDVLYEKFIIEKGFLRGTLTEHMRDYVNYLEVLYENHLTEILSKNPDPRDPGIVNIHNYMLYILEGIYAVAILLVGTSILLLSISPERRAKSKKLLFWFIFGLIITPVFPQILGMLLDVTSALTSDILSLYSGNPATVFTKSLDFLMNEFSNLNEYTFAVAIPFLLLSIFIIMAPLILFSLRYLVVLLLIVISPCTIMLYSFPQTRVFGKAILNAVVVWSFLQVVEALAIVSLFSVIMFATIMGEGFTFIAVIAASLTLIFLFVSVALIKL